MPAIAASDITPLVLTRDEAPNIGRCLERLTWAARVIVLDSGSADETVAIARRCPNVEVHTRRFDDYASQRNYGVSLAATRWVLSLDADHLVPPDFAAVIAALGRETRAESLGLLHGHQHAKAVESPQLSPGHEHARAVETAAIDSASPDPTDVDALVAGFRYCIAGRPLRGSLYPPRPVLFRRARCRYVSDGHAERLVVTGRTAMLPARIDHDDRKSLGRWLRSQRVYARLEAEKLASTPWRDLGWADRARRLVVVAPPGAGVYALFVKGAVLDGWPGWAYALQRAAAEAMLSIAIVRRALTRGTGAAGGLGSASGDAGCAPGGSGANPPR